MNQYNGDQKQQKKLHVDKKIGRSKLKTESLSGFRKVNCCGTMVCMSRVVLFILLVCSAAVRGQIPSYVATVATIATQTPQLVISEGDRVSVQIPAVNKSLYIFANLTVGGKSCQPFNGTSFDFVVPSNGSSEWDNDTTVIETVSTGGDGGISSVVALVLTLTRAMTWAVETYEDPSTTLYVVQPIIYSLCPKNIRVKENSTIFIQATNLLVPQNGSVSPLRCILANSITSIPLSIYSNQVECNFYYPYATSTDDTTGAGPSVNVTLSNSGSTTTLQYYQISATSAVLQGECEADKPGSIPEAGSGSSSQSCVCPAGTEDKIASCAPCGDGFYQNQQGQTSCQACPDNMDTNGMLGSTDSSHCTCKASYLLVKTSADAATGNCTRCPNGMTCLGANDNTLKAKYWVANNYSADVVHCPGTNKACPGGTVGASSNSLCADGYTGPECNVCKHGYAKNGPYDCLKCQNSGLNIFLLFLLICLAAVMLYILIEASNATEKFDRGTDMASAGTMQVDMAAKKTKESSLNAILKIGMNYFQMLYFISKVTTWSPSVEELFSLSGQSTLSTNFFSLNCAMRWTFHSRLIFVYFSPAVFVGAVVAAHLTRFFFFKWYGKPVPIDEAKEYLVLSIFLTLYIIHPSVALQVITSIPCQSVPGTGKSYLVADYSVVCGTTSYNTYTAISILYLFIYIFGLIVLLAYRGLYHNYKTGKLFVDNYAANKRYAFFTRGFQRSAYYWETLIMARKLALVAVAVIIPGALGLTYCAVILVVSFFANYSVRPFNTLFLNKLESLAIGLNYLTVIFGFYFLFEGQDSVAPIVLLLFVHLVFICFLVYLVIVRLSRLAKRWDMPEWVPEKVRRHMSTQSQMAPVAIVMQKNPNAAPSEYENFQANKMAGGDENFKGNALYQADERL